MELHLPLLQRTGIKVWASMPTKMTLFKSQLFCGYENPGKLKKTAYRFLFPAFDLGYSLSLPRISSHGEHVELRLHVEHSLCPGTQSPGLVEDLRVTLTEHLPPLPPTAGFSFTLWAST